MVSARMIRVLVLASLFSAPLTRGETFNHLLVTPESPVVEIGTHFTATCTIIDTEEVTADDLYWKLSDKVVPSDQYTKINRTALSVTVAVRGEELEWLFCLAEKLPYVFLNEGKFCHGIILSKGYAPGKPENLSCMAVQERNYISPTIECVWQQGQRQTKNVPITYTLNFGEPSTKVRTRENHAKAVFSIFPNHMELDIWVEAENGLGKMESEHLKEDAGWIVKTDPPSDIKVISEKSFSTTLLINWSHPIGEEYLELKYQIRFCQNGSDGWTYVPLSDTSQYIRSFRLQNLQPDSVFVTQVRCKNAKQGHGYWSDWSANATERTPEDRPRSKPDLWRIVSEGEAKSERRVWFLCKDPVLANGRIRRFDIRLEDQKEKGGNGSLGWEHVPVDGSELDGSELDGSEVDWSSRRRRISVLKQIQLPDEESVKVFVTAANSVGKSDEASLFIPAKSRELPAVEALKVWPHGGQLWVEWKPRSVKALTEFVVEWVAGGQTDWQRESRGSRNGTIKGRLEKFVCYTVSVYPIYAGRIGKAARMDAFLEQGAPLEGPGVRLEGKPGRNDATLHWKEIPPQRQRGFITNYTVFYTSGKETHSVTVPANTTSYTLTSLTGNTKYDAWIVASTSGGSTNSFNHSFTTLKYAPGEIEGIVVGVSFGFLFVIILIMLLCIYKRDMIKENFWPRIPNPGESTIGNWSPDYPLEGGTAEMPKESCLSGISVMGVDASDGKSVFEEDKTSLPLKKDKYLSEEHSSGIGGSSCMSSPRQSVSDSDEGGDMADTTASTVQYSSVVASNGYKGQTPNCQPAPPAVFSRSESTQPLLDCEENPDTLLQEGGRQSRRFLQRRDGAADPADINQLEMEQQPPGLDAMDFCPLEEDAELQTSADGWMSAAPACSFMSQLGGYRPQ